MFRKMIKSGIFFFDENAKPYFDSCFTNEVWPGKEFAGKRVSISGTCGLGYHPVEATIEKIDSINHRTGKEEWETFKASLDLETHRKKVIGVLCKRLEEQRDQEIDRLNGKIEALQANLE